ncbi:MAG: D-alanine--D-alanine ligase [Tannerella sp.]|nr:D-alanine--D-alanine ligase [Tannerella sp.]
MMKNIAIIAGGYSSEFEVSLRSAENLYTFIDKERYHVYVVILKQDSWKVVMPKEWEDTGNETQHGLQTRVNLQIRPDMREIEVDKNDFSFRRGGETVRFDFAYITIHGTPGENGLLQGYFDMVGIPYSTCGVLAGALTFNKYICNQFLRNRGIAVSDSILLQKGQQVMPEKIVESLSLPVFVKPNEGGSSFGVSKVREASQIQAAVDKAFHESNAVMIERFVQGVEMTCGCYQSKNHIIVFPVTEVVPENDFFDYGAKYNGEVQEITPARISTGLASKIQRETEKIYKLIGAQGIIRVDYIVTPDEMPVMLEINTTPGMTATRFIPQQVQAAGLNMTDIMTEIIENKINKY